MGGENSNGRYDRQRKQDLRCNRSEIILRLRRGCRQKSGPNDDKSCRCRSEPDFENNLSCGVAFPESVWDSGRARLFEVEQRVSEVNRERKKYTPGGKFTGSSCEANELAARPDLALDFIAAPPRMAHYMKISSMIYQIYLKYIAPEDIHSYSIDEVFIDLTSYLETYHATAHELTVQMIREIQKQTKIMATAGIGTNLYLCKIAMDIMAKHIEPDADGVRIAELDEMSYRRNLWDHRPLTDFWRVGRGYAKKLEERGIYTMGDIARCSLGSDGDYYNEDLLYRLFGVNAELLIDHAWGYEPCTIADVKAYKPENHSVGSGQVLACPYTVEKRNLLSGRWQTFWRWILWIRN